MKTTFIKISLLIALAFTFQKANAQNNQTESATDSLLVY